MPWDDKPLVVRNGLTEGSLLSHTTCGMETLGKVSPAPAPKVVPVAGESPEPGKLMAQ